MSGNAHRDWIEAGVDDTGSALVVNCCGYQKLETRDLVRNREKGRLDYQLIYVVGGKGTFRFGGKSAEATEVPDGNIVLYSPGEPQHYSYRSANGTEAYWVHFTGSAARDYVSELGQVGSPVRAVGIMDEAVDLFKSIIRELNVGEPLSGTMASAYLLQLLALFGRRLRNAEAHRKAEPHADIHRIIAIMHEKYNRRLVVGELAQACNLSLFRFIHKFKAVTGKTPVQYVTGIRINEAKRMLAETSLHVKEVAAIVGYDNPLYFSRVFGQATGMPPSRYKDQFS
ncbi:AraC family transcriptional regulator [Cohnella sp. GCM10027633]|uniref:AraC family transcriptional regulator n=1 Tax=unclassified Cohnella TaxID=2636738 RepID=UPI0036720B54